MKYIILNDGFHSDQEYICENETKGYLDDLIAKLCRPHSEAFEIRVFCIKNFDVYFNDHLGNLTDGLVNFIDQFSCDILKPQLLTSEDFNAMWNKSYEWRG